MYQQIVQILLALSLYITRASATIVLSQFQQINNFPQTCEDAYNAPISGCDASDFPKSCSSHCVYALEQAQATIDNACVGSQAPLDSLIGQLFQGNGAQFLCTGDFDLGSSASSSCSSSTTILSSTASTSSASSDTITSTSLSSSKAKSTISTSSTSRRTTTVSALTSTASSTSASFSPLSSSSANSKSKASKVFLTTAFNNGVATTLTSQAERTSAASSNPDAFGGGGSPFEVGPNGNDAARAVAGCSMLIAMFGVGFMLLR